MAETDRGEETMTITEALTEYRAMLWKEHTGAGGTFQPDTCPACKKIAEVDALIAEVRHASDDDQR